jgi:hypothetical protein
MTSTEQRRVRALRPHRILATLVVLALGTVPAATAHAQPKDAGAIQSARDAYNEGVTLRDKGDLRGALIKFKAAHALARTPITGVELARTHETLGELVEASEVCLGVGRTPISAEETARSAQARRDALELAGKLESRVATLRIVITGVKDPADAEVTVDGNLIPGVALQVPRRLNPGKHEILAHVGKGPEARAQIELKEGDKSEIELKVELPPPEPAIVGPVHGGPAPGQPNPRAAEADNSRTFVYIGGAALVVGGGLGAITGLMASSEKDKLDTACANNTCPPAQHDALDDAKLLGNVATLGFIVGGIGAGVLVYGLVSAPPKAKVGTSVSPWLGLGSAGLNGRF